MEKQILIGLISAIAGFIFNSLLKEKWKNILLNENEKLKNQFSKELTALQSKLISQREKDNFRFTKFHEKKFEVYENLYSLLNKYFIDVGVFCNPVTYKIDQENIENFQDLKFKLVIKSQENLLVYFDNKKIYLKEDIILYLHRFLDIADKGIQNNNLILFFEKINIKVENEIYVDAHNAYNILISKLMPIKIEIEKLLKEEVTFIHE